MVLDHDSESKKHQCGRLIYSMDKKITVFTDGAAKGNPGRGGFGVVIANGDSLIELGGYKERTTNNEMELTAVVKALQTVHLSMVNIFLWPKDSTVLVLQNSLKMVRLRV